MTGMTWWETPYQRVPEAGRLCRGAAAAPHPHAENTLPHWGCSDRWEGRGYRPIAETPRIGSINDIFTPHPNSTRSVAGRSCGTTPGGALAATGVSPWLTSP